MKQKLPILKSREVVRALGKAGFFQARQTGSHLILKNVTTGKIVPVPLHTKTLKRGLLLAIIKESGLNPEAFLKLLKKKN